MLYTDAVSTLLEILDPLVRLHGGHGYSDGVSTLLEILEVR